MMRSPERSAPLPGRRRAQDAVGRLRQQFGAAPLPLKILLIVAVCVVAAPFISLILVGALFYAPYAVWAGQRGVLASLAVAVWGIVAVLALGHGQDNAAWYALWVLPLAAVAAAHAGTLGRWFIPCRTVAWTLLWALPVGIVM